MKCIETISTQCMDIQNEQMIIMIYITMLNKSDIQNNVFGLIYLDIAENYLKSDKSFIKKAIIGKTRINAPKYIEYMFIFFKF